MSTSTSVGTHILDNSNDPGENPGRLRKTNCSCHYSVHRREHSAKCDGLAEEEHLNVRLSVTAGRGGSSRLKYRKLASITRQVRDDGGDGIMIFETVQGTRVRYGELVLRKPVEITKIGNTVDHRARLAGDVPPTFAS